MMIPQKNTFEVQIWGGGGNCSVSHSSIQSGGCSSVGWSSGSVSVGTSMGTSIKIAPCIQFNNLTMEVGKIVIGYVNDKLQFMMIISCDLVETENLRNVGKLYVAGKIRDYVNYVTFMVS